MAHLVTATGAFSFSAQTTVLQAVAEGVTKNHPEWVHGGAAGGLLKMDEPEVVRWITDHVDKMITEQGIDLYRQDFNIDPLRFWQQNDAEDRQGITENHHVTAYLAYWDELRRRHADMLIDSCASGGRRNDLETLRRAVPLLRSDYLFDPRLIRALAGAEPTLLQLPAEQKSLLLDEPVEELPVVRGIGWNGLANRSTVAAILFWWLVVVAIGVIAFPVTYATFRFLGDRGYALSKGIVIPRSSRRSIMEASARE